jgi:hypothetical protein
MLSHPIMYNHGLGNMYNLRREDGKLDRRMNIMSAIWAGTPRSYDCYGVDQMPMPLVLMHAYPSADTLV